MLCQAASLLCQGAKEETEWQAAYEEVLALLVPPLITLGNISCQWNGIWAEEGCLGLLWMDLATRTELLVTLTHTGKCKDAHTKYTRAVFPFNTTKGGGKPRGKILDDDGKNPLRFAFINVCDAIKRFFFSPKINIFFSSYYSKTQCALQLLPKTSVVSFWYKNGCSKLCWWTKRDKTMTGGERCAFKRRTSCLPSYIYLYINYN